MAREMWHGHVWLPVETGHSCLLMMWLLIEGILKCAWLFSLLRFREMLQKWPDEGSQCYQKMTQKLTAKKFFKAVKWDILWWPNSLTRGESLYSLITSWLFDVKSIKCRELILQNKRKQNKICLCPNIYGPDYIQHASTFKSWSNPYILNPNLNVKETL